MLKFIDLKEKGGITILALTITIIILLILAGISIAMLTGDNDLIRNAVSVKEQVEIDGENNYTSEKVNEGIEVTINSKRIYLIDKDGNVTEFSGIKLSDKELLLTIVNGILPEYTITASKFSLTGDINWESSDITVATIENGKVIAVDSGKTTITAKCTSNGKLYTAICEVEVMEPIDYSYVKYDVEYKDVYTGTQYTKNTGWRLLSQEDNGDGTYDIEIISTGIPAKLNYDWNTIKNFESTTPITIGKWAGDIKQRQDYAEEYSIGNNTIQNVFVAAGLQYNFENIVFNTVGTTSTLTSDIISANYGGYIEIRNQGNNIIASDSTTGKDLFRANINSGKITSIREVNFEDITGTKDFVNTCTITDKKIGLFKLNSYTPDNHENGVCYWLATLGYGQIVLI